MVQLTDVRPCVPAAYGFRGQFRTRGHLSAINATSPAGKLYFYSQGRAINADNVIGLIAHLLR